MTIRHRRLTEPYQTGIRNRNALSCLFFRAVHRIPLPRKGGGRSFWLCWRIASASLLGRRENTCMSPKRMPDFSKPAKEVGKAISLKSTTPEIPREFEGPPELASLSLAQTVPGMPQPDEDVSTWRELLNKLRWSVGSTYGVSYRKDSCADEWSRFLGWILVRSNGWPTHQTK